MSSKSSEIAFLFPGQGAHCSSMLDGLRQCSRFDERYGYVVSKLGFDPLKGDVSDDVINANKVSSVLTVLASSLSQDLLHGQGIVPAFAAGYSVGQWTALYAAGSLTFQSLVDVVLSRAALMDACFAERAGAMLAVIGLPLSAVEEVCAGIVAEGHFLVISNFNCVGQYSLAGDVPAVEKAIQRFESTSAKKVQRLPVAGAWHCELLEPATNRFEEVLSSVDLSAPGIPVIDNVTGDFLPLETTALKRQLSLQISSPVQWERSIHNLCATGCTQFIEVGYGNVLTKFGFFINRKVAHKSFYSGNFGGQPCAV